MTDVGTATSTDPARRAAERGWSMLRRHVTPWVRTGLVLALLVVAYAYAPWDRWDDTSVLFRLIFWWIAVIVAVILQVRAVLHADRPWVRAMQGALLSVAMLLLPFAAVYAGLSQSDAANFTQPLTRLDAVYFTVTVFATVGFGDIAPVSDPARMLVTMQMLADLMLIGIIIKVLIGAAEHRRHELKEASSAGAERTGSDPPPAR